MENLNSKKIYLIRHGQTDYNKRGVVQGRGINASLNDLGQKQARAFYEKYKDVDFKKVYTSSLKRTAQSVNNFIQDNIPHEALGGLDEISWGDSEGKPFDDHLNNRYLDVVSAWREGDISCKMKGGESPVEVKERQKEAMDYILSQNDESPILICMHGRALRILLSWITGQPLKDMDTFEHNNLGLYTLIFEGDTFKIDKFNDVEHLKGILHES